MKLTTDFNENIAKINESIGVGRSYDVAFRTYKIFGREVYLYYVTPLVNTLEVIGVMERLLELPQNEKQKGFFEIIYNNITHQGTTIIDTFEDVYNRILNGIIVLVMDGSNKAIAIETRSYPTRSISEPDIEKVIRGSHDGFTENFNTNIGLMRRRIKDGRLRNILFQIGTASQTYVCLSYIDGICDPDLIATVTKKLENVKTDHLIMTDKALEELILKQTFNPYPLVRYTERADIISIHLYKGCFAIFVDTSPSVILAPATFFDHLQHAEEYRQTPISGSYLRIMRYLGVFLSLFLTPVWLLFVMNNTNLPELLRIFIPDKTVHASVFLQIIAAELGVEFLRMASIHTPSALSTAMGLVAGILIGDIAIKVGVFSIQTVFLVAISTIGTYVTPSYELGLANKLCKIIFLVVIFLFNIPGFIVIVLLWILFLASLKSFNRRYLYPLIPFDIKKIKEVLFRLPNKEVKKNAKIKM